MMPSRSLPYIFVSIALFAHLATSKNEVYVEDSSKTIQSMIASLLSPRCYNILVLDGDVFHKECLQLVLSKALGIAIITGSFILKVPQISKIIQAGDATGLSPLSLYLEVILYLSATIYNAVQGYPVSTWGENLIILLQNLVLVHLIHKFQNPKTSLKTQLNVMFSFSVIALAMYQIPGSYQYLLYAASIPVTIYARIFQLLKNYKQGHTGQLAVITLILNFAGSAARFFTTLQETGDVMQLLGFGVAILLNGVLVSQVLYYWTATNRALAAKSKKE